MIAQFNKTFHSTTCFDYLTFDEFSSTTIIAIIVVVIIIVSPLSSSSSLSLLFSILLGTNNRKFHFFSLCLPNLIFSALLRIFHDAPTITLAPLVPPPSLPPPPPQFVIAALVWCETSSPRRQHVYQAFQHRIFDR